MIELRPALLTSAQVAEWLGITQAALELRRHRKKSPPHIRLGRIVRYEPETVAAWIDAQREDPAATL